MKSRSLFIILVCFLVVDFTVSHYAVASDVQGTPTVLSIEEPNDDLASTQRLASDHRKIMHELRYLKREIVQLKQELAQPDSRDIFAGIGYIFGLMGVAFYFTARKK